MYCCLNLRCLVVLGLASIPLSAGLWMLKARWCAARCRPKAPYRDRAAGTRTFERLIVGLAT
jgi:hypothetical protein